MDPFRRCPARPPKARPLAFGKEQAWPRERQDEDRRQADPRPGKRGLEGRKERLGRRQPGRQCAALRPLEYGAEPGGTANDTDRARDQSKATGNAALFGEHQGRYLIETVAPDAILAAAKNAGIYAQIIGTVAGTALTLPGGGAISVNELTAANEAWLPAYMAGG